jgi:lysophospholipase L1-like esterase
MAGSATAQQAGQQAAPRGPQRWEPDIRKFEDADRTSPPPAGAVLFVGSSSIVKWTSLAQDFPDLKTIRRGFGGSELSDTLYYADRIILPYRPSTVVVYAGDNDLANGRLPEAVFMDYLALVRKIHRALPETRIAFIAVKPSLKRWNLIEQVRRTNELVRTRAASDPRLMFIDIATPMLGTDGKPRPELFVNDGLHLSPEGYALWTRVVGAALRGPQAKRS